MATSPCAKPGTEQFAPVVQPAHIELKPNKDGTPQKSRSLAIPNQQVGGTSLKLNATADSGLPVRYFVNQGPARIQGDELILTPVPPRTKFPIKISVVAWQWGRSTEPAVKTAASVERTFYLVNDPVPHTSYTK
jgi:hypothetical protein